MSAGVALEVQRMPPSETCRAYQHQRRTCNDRDLFGSRPIPLQERSDQHRHNEDDAGETEICTLPR
jgi:hypothetical protein